MKRLKLLFLPFLFLTGPCFAEEKPYNLIYPQGGEVQTYDASNTVDNYLSAATNVWLDQELGVVKRGGFDKDSPTSIGSFTVKDLWRFVDSSNNEYQVALASYTLSYTVGNSSYVVISSTMAIEDKAAAPALGKLYVTGPSQAFSFDGSTTIGNVSTDFPRGKDIAFHKQRLWVVGVPGNTSILYGSEQLADNWTLGGNPTDAVQFSIGLNDGDPLIAIKSFGDILLIFKRRSTWVLIGSDQTDFQLLNLSPTIGCIQRRSVQVKQNRVVWLSHRGLMKLEGGVIQPFTYNLKTWTDQILSVYGDVGNNVSNSYADTNESDFTVGVSSYVSASNTPGSIVFLGVNTTTLTRSSGLEQPNTGDEQAGWARLIWANTPSRSFTMKFIPNLSMRVLSMKPQLASLSIFGKSGVPLTCSLRTGTTHPAAVDLTSATVVVNIPSGGQAFTPEFLFSTGNTVSAGTTYWLVVNTTISYSESTTLWVSIDTQTLLSRDYTMEWENVKDDTNWCDTCGFPLSGFLKFVLVPSSAQYTSGVKAFGTNLARFGTFLSEYTPNNGSVDFYDRSGTNLSNLLGQSYVSQSVGAKVIAAANPFGDYRIIFQVTAATQTPSVQSVAWNWTDTVSRNPVCSWVRDDRYYLSHTTSSASSSHNDYILVLDRFDAPVYFKGIEAASFGEAFNHFYFGVSTATGSNAGYVFYFKDAFDDAGSAISASFETKDYCTDDCFVDKTFSRLYVRLRNTNTGSGTLSVSYQIDRDGVYWPLGDISYTENDGLITAILPIPFSGGGNKGKTIRFKFLNNEVGQNLLWLGGRLYYTPDPPQ